MESVFGAVLQLLCSTSTVSGSVVPVYIAAVLGGAALAIVHGVGIVSSAAQHQLLIVITLAVTLSHSFSTIIAHQGPAVCSSTITSAGSSTSAFASHISAWSSRCNAGSATHHDVLSSSVCDVANVLVPDVALSVSDCILIGSALLSTFATFAGTRVAGPAVRWSMLLMPVLAAAIVPRIEITTWLALTSYVGIFIASYVYRAEVVLVLCTARVTAALVVPATWLAGPQNANVIAIAQWILFVNSCAYALWRYQLNVQNLQFKGRKAVTLGIHKSFVIIVAQSMTGLPLDSLVLLPLAWLLDADTAWSSMRRARRAAHKWTLATLSSLIDSSLDAPKGRRASIVPASIAPTWVGASVFRRRLQDVGVQSVLALCAVSIGWAANIAAAGVTAYGLDGQLYKSPVRLFRPFSAGSSFSSEAAGGLDSVSSPPVVCIPVPDVSGAWGAAPRQYTSISDSGELFHHGNLHAAPLSSFVGRLWYTVYAMFQFAWEAGAAVVAPLPPFDAPGANIGVHGARAAQVAQAVGTMLLLPVAVGHGLALYLAAGAAWILSPVTSLFEGGQGGSRLSSDGAAAMPTWLPAGDVAPMLTFSASSGNATTWLLRGLPAPYALLDSNASGGLSPWVLLQMAMLVAGWHLVLRGPPSEGLQRTLRKVRSLLGADPMTDADRSLVGKSRTAERVFEQAEAYSDDAVFDTEADGGQDMWLAMPAFLVAPLSLGTLLWVSQALVSGNEYRSSDGAPSSRSASGSSSSKILVGLLDVLPSPVLAVVMLAFVATCVLPRHRSTEMLRGLAAFSHTVVGAMLVVAAALLMRSDGDSGVRSFSRVTATADGTAPRWEACLKLQLRPASPVLLAYYFMGLVALGSVVKVAVFVKQLRAGQRVLKQMKAESASASSQSMYGWDAAWSAWQQFGEDDDDEGEDATDGADDGSDGRTEYSDRHGTAAPRDQHTSRPRAQSASSTASSAGARRPSVSASSVHGAPPAIPTGIPSAPSHADSDTSHSQALPHQVAAPLYQSGYGSTAASASFGGHSYDHGSASLGFGAATVPSASTLQHLPTLSDAAGVASSFTASYSGGGDGIGSGVARHNTGSSSSSRPGMAFEAGSRSYTHHGDTSGMPTGIGSNNSQYQPQLPSQGYGAPMATGVGYGGGAPSSSFGLSHSQPSHQNVQQPQPEWQQWQQVGITGSGAGTTASLAWSPAATAPSSSRQVPGGSGHAQAQAVRAIPVAIHPAASSSSSPGAIVSAAQAAAMRRSGQAAGSKRHRDDRGGEDDADHTYDDGDGDGSDAEHDQGGARYTYNLHDGPGEGDMDGDVDVDGDHGQVQYHDNQLQNDDGDEGEGALHRMHELQQGIGDTADGDRDMGGSGSGLRYRHGHSQTLQLQGSNNRGMRREPNDDNSSDIDMMHAVGLGLGRQRMGIASPARSSQQQQMQEQGVHRSAKRHHAAGQVDVTYDERVGAGRNGHYE